MREYFIVELLQKWEKAYFVLNSSNINSYGYLFVKIIRFVHQQHLAQQHIINPLIRADLT
jgi:hypothetical protein